MDSFDGEFNWRGDWSVDADDSDFLVVGVDFIMSGDRKVAVVLWSVTKSIYIFYICH